MIRDQARQQNPRAFIFDMDGTLVDNMNFHTQSWLALFDSLGIHLDPDEFRSTAGMTNPEILRHFMRRNLTADEIQELGEKKEIFYRKQYKPHLAAVNGLVAFLEQAKVNGIPMAVATSAGQQNIQFTLEGLKIKGFFNAIVGADEIQNGKPDPEIFLKAAQRLQVSPHDCIVFEDSRFGIEAANRAGMKAVLLTTYHQPADMGTQVDIFMAVSDFSILDIQSLL